MTTWAQDFFANRGAFDIGAVFKFNDITPDIQRHLSKVYAALTYGVAVAAAGAAAHVALGLWHAPLLYSLGMVGAMMWLMASRGESLTKRLAIFTLLSGLQGLALGGFVASLAWFDPSIITTALLGTTATFACFSAFALVSQRRSMLFLGGIISSVVSWMLLASFLNLFLRSTTVFTAELYLGLGVFVAYVVFDTQLIVEKAAAGNRDFLTHATELLLDFVGLFVRIAIILARNSERKRESRRNGRQ